MVTTYVVPLSRAKAVAVGALNLVVFAALLTVAGVGLAGSGGQFSAGSWALVTLWLVGAVAITAWNLRQVRRRYYLVRRLSLLGAPAGAYPVRPKGEGR